MSIADLCRPLARPCPGGCGALVVIFVDSPVCWECEQREIRAVGPRSAEAPLPAPVARRARSPRSVPDAIQSLFDEEAGPVPAGSLARGGRR